MKDPNAELGPVGVDPSDLPAWTAYQAPTPASDPAAAATTPPPADPASFPPPPAHPDGHYGHDLHGAESMALHFLDLYTYAFQTGNTAPLEAISGPDCQFCKGLVLDVKNFHETGRVREGGGLRVHRYQSFSPEETGSFYLVQADVTQDAQLIRVGNITSASSAEERIIVSVGLEPTGTGWMVVGVSTEGEDD